MSTTLATPDILSLEHRPPIRPRKRWTVSEVRDLVALGRLPESGYELIEGDLLIALPKNMPHVVAVNKVLRWIYGTFGIEYTQVQDPIAINPFSSPEPDVCVLRQAVETYLPTGTPSATEAILLIEVADSTLEYDLTTKAGLYARAGVAEYWVLDVTGRELNILTNPLDGVYSSRQTFSETDSASPLANPNASVRVGDLLP